MKRTLVLGSLVLVGVFAASVWSYRTSLNRIGVEPFIAVVKPTSITTNPFNITGFPIEGKLKIYSSPSFSDDVISFKFIVNGQTYNYTITGSSSVNTDFSVKPGDTVNLTVYMTDGVKNFYFYGWAAPTDQGVSSCPTKLQSRLAAAQAANLSIISQQCWNDDKVGDDYYDDLAILIAQIPGTAVSPSPSPSPSAGASPSPSASLTAEQVQYQVLPFNDANRNGVRDSGEGTIPGATFKYKVYINADPPQDYTVEAGAEGKIIDSGKGTKLKVEQIDTPGWVRTTPPSVSIEMTESKLYKVDFGNYNQSTGGMPSQPDTGTPTVLTVSLLILAPLLYFARKRYAQKR
jgi:hypothetical protein